MKAKIRTTIKLFLFYKSKLLIKQFLLKLPHQRHKLDLVQNNPCHTLKIQIVNQNQFYLCVFDFQNLNILKQRQIYQKQV